TCHVPVGSTGYRLCNAGGLKVESRWILMVILVFVEQGRRLIARSLANSAPEWVIGKRDRGSAADRRRTQARLDVPGICRVDISIGVRALAWRPIAISHDGTGRQAPIAVVPKCAGR